jgi:hypothetical protein
MIVMGNKYDVTDLEVCVVCINLLCIGEYDDGTDAAEVAREGMSRIWGDDAYLVPGGEDLGFSALPCDTCGDDHHGERYSAAVLSPSPR